MLDGLKHYEDLAGMVEMNEQKLLEEHNYNTLGNFLRFYDSFKRSHCQNFLQFYQSYSPPITKEHYTCVGLALELWHRLRYLNELFPNIWEYFYLVSCEENVTDMPKYVATCESVDTASYDVEKEHVLLCLHFHIGERVGYLLCDPGYHVGRVVTVMADRMYPHTGWFLQYEEGNIRKEYNYQLSTLNDGFVQWDSLTSRNGRKDGTTAMIYVARPYVTAVDVTERRNLVYNFRSLLSRDQKGHLIAGVYFKVKETCDECTIFYQDMGKQRLKISFSALLNIKVNEKIRNIIIICNEQLNLPEGTLWKMLKQTAELMKDKDYLHQLLNVNRCIGRVSEDN